MIDFNTLNVNRLIIHTINNKKEGQDSATVAPSNEISVVDENVLELIKIRLIDAAGRNSKAFELDIEYTQQGSFFQLSNSIKDLDEEGFIKRTTEITDLLADSQRRTSIPGGYLMVMDCQDSETALPVIVVIKAEPHEALQFSISGGQTLLNVLRKVFLSPSQKLYKIGILYQKVADDEVEDIEKYGCFLYDDQFRTDTHPAEYFYKDFLGFSVGTNSKIQSQRFYDKTKTFITTEVSDFGAKKDLLLALKQEFTVNQVDTVSPINFANTFLPQANGLRDKYIGEVCNELPNSVVKDKSLIKNRLSKRKVNFPRNINLSGPEESFDSQVEILNEQSIINDLNPNSEEYTVIKIAGKPYSTSE